MSVWSQIMQDFAEAPKITKKAGVIPDTHKRCSLCQKVKLRTEFYKKPGDSTNSVTPKCKPCHKAYNLKRKAEKETARKAASAQRNKELAEKAKQWEKEWSK